jgi:hypothetical protein
MPKTSTRRSKIALALFCGLIVASIAGAIHMATMPLEHTIVLHILVGDFIAGLTSVIVCLAIQLKQEEVHYQTSIERAAIVAELNHHIRNAVFPLCLAVQKTGDAESIKVAAEAVDRINIALKDATVDALSGRTSYGAERRQGEPAD